MRETTPRHPGVHFPPPLIFAVGVFAGWLIDRAWPLHLVDDARHFWVEIAGWVAVGLGLGMLAWALVTFRRARTAIYPNRPARTVVAHGPYRLSRNPMYVALAAVSAGIAFLANSVWILAALPPALLLLTRLVIRREEAYLAAEFGPAYEDYCRTVRRWL